MSKSARGFTLVELLVVISIIAILSVIGLTIFSSAQKSARDGKRRGDLHAIALALEQYKLINGTYPKIDPLSTTCSNRGDTLLWIKGLDSNYMVSIPLDPINDSGTSYSGTGYSYCYYSGMPSDYSGTSFMLTTRMESPNSADRTSKCTDSRGLTWGSTNATGLTAEGYRYRENLFVCNQQ